MVDNFPENIKMLIRIADIHAISCGYDVDNYDALGVDDLDESAKFLGTLGNYTVNIYG
jgi:hypothetical protein